MTWRRLLTLPSTARAAASGTACAEAPLGAARWLCVPRRCVARPRTPPPPPPV